MTQTKTKIDWSQHEADVSHIRHEDFVDENGIYDFEAATAVVDAVYLEKWRREQREQRKARDAEAQQNAEPLRVK